MQNITKLVLTGLLVFCLAIATASADGNPGSGTNSKGSTEGSEGNGPLATGGSIQVVDPCMGSCQTDDDCYALGGETCQCDIETIGVAGTCSRDVPPAVPEFPVAETAAAIAAASPAFAYALAKKRD